jgi:hypothetical protein
MFVTEASLQSNAPVAEKKRHFATGAALRAALALVLFGAWHGSQTLLDHAKRAMGGTSFDRGHALLAPVNDFLHHHDHVANAILIMTSAHIDLVLTGMVLWGILGETIRPTVAIFFILIFRQLSQLLVSEPVPVGMIWHYPGFPSLIVTYYTTFDFFFSGHTASATLSALEIGHRNYKNKIYLILAILLVFMEIFAILSMRFHYTADVITGIFASVTAFVLALKVTPPLDRAFQNLVERLTA